MPRQNQEMYVSIDKETAGRILSVRRGFANDTVLEPFARDIEADEQDPELEKYREAAKHTSAADSECEIDPGAGVSVSDDGGAYVQAWVRVDDETARIRRAPCLIRSIE
jgi:hypothetical protein